MSMAEHFWSVHQGSNDGLPLILRRNDTAPSLLRPDVWAVRVGIAIPLRAPEANGLPNVAEDRELGAIENLIVSTVGSEAVLVLVITTSGMREFVLHAHATHWIAGFHQYLMATVTTHEVQCMAEMDPGWSVYRSFCS